MPYNLSLINATGLVKLTQTVNQELMFGWFGNMALISIFAIFFISFYQNTENGMRSFSYAITMVAILSVPLRALSLVFDEAVYITWILAAGSVLLLFIFD